MKRFKYIALIVAVAGLAFAGCERSYDDPKPQKIYTDADFAPGEIVPISTVKQLYYDNFGTSTIGESLQIAENYVIKGKVISNDRYGNIYRVMHIQDESGAIEIKTGLTGNYNFFTPGQYVYVICRPDIGKALTLGNYRYMLSLGYESMNPSYANGYIDLKLPLLTNDRSKGAVILQGEYVGFTAADTTVVRSYTELNDNLTGRLVRIEGATHVHRIFDRTQYPSFLEQKPIPGQDDQYTDFAFEDVIADWNRYEADSIKWVNGSGPKPVVPVSPKPGNMAGATYAFKNPSTALNYYGTALIKFGPSDTELTQNLLLRSSGYARFANTLLPPDGQKVNVTGFYTKYSNKQGIYIKYQLVINNSSDVVYVN